MACCAFGLLLEMIHVRLRFTPAFAVLMCALLVSGPLLAEIYKWVDDQGRTRYSDKAPPQTAARTRVETIDTGGPVNTVEGQDVSVAEFLSKAEAAEKKRAAARTKRVVMYSTVWCGVCKKARRYFRANDIPFKEFDVETSERGRKDYARLNGRGVPIVLVGKYRMDGFNPGRFQQVYRQAGN